MAKGSFNWEKLTNGIGFTLIAGFFLYSVYYHFNLKGSENTSGKKVLRFVHWQLESGAREAYDLMAEGYEKLHPDVDVQQMIIPERAYLAWCRTQLVGGTAPDIMGFSGKMTEEIIGRNFIPVSKWVNDPNPYNKGTDLEGVPWKDTFLNGLEDPACYFPNLLEYIGIPNYTTTIRVYYNVDLLKEITGNDHIPQTYDELIELCQKVTEFGEKNHRILLPFAGSRYNGKFLYYPMSTAIMQKVSQANDVRCQLDDTGAPLQILQKKWTLNDEAVRASFGIVRELGRYMQQGFLQLEREDATFYFVQKRALMIASGSWDAQSYKVQSPFPIKAFDLPTPGPDHPMYGKYILGNVQETLESRSGGFGITRDSKHKDLAIDFLKFMTSKEQNAIYCRACNRLPSVIEVTPNEEMQVFMPKIDGYYLGFTLLNAIDSAEYNRLMDNELYRLVSANGSVDDFLQAVIPQVKKAIRFDMNTAEKNRLRMIKQHDSTMGIFLARMVADPEDADSRRKMDEAFASEVSMESDIYFMRHELKRNQD